MQFQNPMNYPGFGAVLVLGCLGLATPRASAAVDPLSIGLFDASNPAYVKVPDAPGLPRVLILGDSISNGYTLLVRARLQGLANVHRPAENCGPSGNGLRRLHLWLGDEHWDVIHFNFGLHDMKYLDAEGNYVPPDKGKQVASVAQYEQNLRELVARLKQTGAKLIFATTTPVPANSRARIEGDERRYNEAALRVMKETGVAVDDLWSWVKPRQAEIQKVRDVHYLPEGYGQLADLVAANILSALPPRPHAANRADRLEWFRDQGFGLFIHWSFDVQIGTVISHSVVGASDDYVKRFYSELPPMFNPRSFYPEDWAALAKLAGIKYVVFTTKHHSGFCMYDTATTDFNVMHVPFHRDATAEIFQAFRHEGIAAGVYFSPDDFWWLNHHGITLKRKSPEVEPSHNPGLLAYDQAQVRELMTRYGKIDMVFLDGEANGLRELAWQIQPNTVVTRGAIRTPELHTMDKPLDEAWESCITMSHAWQYQPTSDVYKTGGECLSLLVQTRAEGGNLLLDVGPKPNGELPIQQEDRLREIALWMFVNGECIYGVRPWIITNEKTTWFTRKKATDTLYAILDEEKEWPYGAWKDIVLKSVRATAGTEVSVLGQNDKVLEYRNDVIPQTTWHQEKDGLHIRAMHAQRLHDDHTWPNPVVLKLTHVQPSFTPPRADSGTAGAKNGIANFTGILRNLGDAPSLAVGFEYRDTTGQDGDERNVGWTLTPATTLKAPGNFSATVRGLLPGHTYEMRTLVRHPLVTIYGDEMKFQAL